MKARAILMLKKWWGLVALLLAVAVVVALGGFGRRSDMLPAAVVGAEIDCVNLVFTFSEATAQRVVSGYTDPYWEVVAIGTVRNPNDAGTQPLLGDYGQFAFKDPSSGSVVVPGWGDAVIGSDPLRSQVVPGMGAVSFTISAKFDATFSPGDEILFGVSRAEYTDNVVLGLGNGRKNWNRDSLAPTYLFTLPVRALPDRTTA